MKQLNFRKTLLVIAICLNALLIAGCSGSTNTSSNQNSNISSNQTSTAALGVYWTGKQWDYIYVIKGIAWSGSQFAAVGKNISNGPTVFSGVILTSPDGSTWTTLSTIGTGTTSPLNGITSSGTQFVAVGDAGTILTSPDGATWTGRTSGTTYPLNGITWSGTQFAAVGGHGTILTSPDGIVWTKQNYKYNVSYTADLYGVAWSGTTFAAVGLAHVIFTSSDGTNWDHQTAIVFSQLPGPYDEFPTLYGIVWSGTRFAAVGDWSTEIISTNTDPLSSSGSSGTGACLVTGCGIAGCVSDCYIKTQSECSALDNPNGGVTASFYAGQTCP